MRSEACWYAKRSILFSKLRFVNILDTRCRDSKREGPIKNPQSLSLVVPWLAVSSRGRGYGNPGPSSLVEAAGPDTSMPVERGGTVEAVLQEELW